MQNKNNLELNANEDEIRLIWRNIWHCYGDSLRPSVSRQLLDSVFGKQL